MLCDSCPGLYCSKKELLEDLEALQRFAPNFLSLLLNCFVDAEVEVWS